jgi:hypothetical protein
MAPLVDAMRHLEQAVAEFQSLMQVAVGAIGMGPAAPGGVSPGSAPGAEAPGNPQQALADFRGQSNNMQRVDKAVSDQVIGNNLSESLAKHLSEMGHV